MNNDSILMCSYLPIVICVYDSYDVIVFIISFIIISLIVFIFSVILMLHVRSLMIQLVQCKLCGWYKKYGCNKGKSYGHMA